MKEKYKRGLVLAGPEIISLDRSKCKGCSSCGKCIERCIFDANSIGIGGTSVVDYQKCLGCGLCASTCPTGARQLVRRKDYKHEDKLTTRILLGS